jgi:hypothetical protein
VERRTFLAMVSGSLFAAPLAAEAQQAAKTGPVSRLPDDGAGFDFWRMVPALSEFGHVEAESWTSVPPIRWNCESLEESSARRRTSRTRTVSSTTHWPPPLGATSARAQDAPCGNSLRGARQHRLPPYNPGMETKSLYAKERSGDDRWAV